MIVDKFTERGGAPYYADDLDDLYEVFFGWGLFYAIGGNERVLDMALDKWNAVTRWADSDIVSRKKHGMWNRGAHREPFRQQITKEYFNLALPHGAEWHHMGEANMTFYEMGLADPTISENFRRAQPVRRIPDRGGPRTRQITTRFTGLFAHPSTAVSGRI